MQALPVVGTQLANTMTFPSTDISFMHLTKS